jgi:hypothetical protein
MFARRVLTIGLFGGLVSSLCASVPEARAEDTKNACATSYENAQVLNRKADFLAARDAMRACARDACPAFIKNDCIQWLSDVEKSIPSVVLSAQIDGRDVHEVRVEMDGKPFADTLDGHSVDVNPGRHTFTFKYQVGQDHPTQDVVVVVVEGQKNRAVQSTYQTPPPPPDEIHRPVPAGVYLLGGLGVLAMGGFATFAELGMSKKNQLNAAGACSPFCSDSQVSPVKTDFLIGDISLAAGVVALASSAVVLLTRPTIVIHPGGHVEAEKAAFVPFVDVDVSSTTRGVRLGARF